MTTRTACAWQDESATPRPRPWQRGSPRTNVLANGQPWSYDPGQVNYANVVETSARSVGRKFYVRLLAEHKSNFDERRLLQ